MEYVAKKSLKEFSTLSMLAITGCYQVYLFILPMIGGWSFKREVRPIKTELSLLGRYWTSDINNPDQYQDVPRISTAASQEAQSSPLYSASSAHGQLPAHTWHRAPAPALRTFVTQPVVVKPNVAPPGDPG